jgi:chromosome segregation ATPase
MSDTASEARRATGESGRQRDWAAAVEHGMSKREALGLTNLATTLEGLRQTLISLRSVLDAQMNQVEEAAALLASSEMVTEMLEASRTAVQVAEADARVARADAELESEAADTAWARVATLKTQLSDLSEQLTERAAHAAAAQAAHIEAMSKFDADHLASRFHGG